MNTTTYKRWMPPGIIACLLMLIGISSASAYETYYEYLGWRDYGYYAWCEECGTAKGVEYQGYSMSDAEAEFDAKCDEWFCSGCGMCSEDFNSECYAEHHCYMCGGCLDEGSIDDSYADEGIRFCEECWDENAERKPEYFCHWCHTPYGYGVDLCECSDMVIPHCRDCSELQCQQCGGCMIVGGEETYLAEGGCLEHGVCGDCLQEGIEDGEHCPRCHRCDIEICDECGLCEGCIENSTLHCPECDYCFGNEGEVQWCGTGGIHCFHCCEENGWLCPECGSCLPTEGQDFCDECGLCGGCCKANSEDSGCTHHYCIESSEFDDHLCPNCMKCPDDNECEYCGLCEECMEDYHCEHEICPESAEWDEHLCSDCGECFEIDELCEYCGKCEDCQEHCEHGYCPDDASFEDDFDHFICQQCGDCYEGFDRCDYCELCNDCCEANTQSVGCDHDLCVESEDFAEHWCYTDDQCLDKCDHNPACAHGNIGTEWASNESAHWKVCLVCGAAVEKAIHTEGATTIITQPNSALHRNGTARVSCSVCAQYMGTVTVPYIPAPADGSPYIIDQPKDYTGKVSDTAFGENPRYASFAVRAGGSGLSYQWYWYRKGYNVPVVKLEDKRGDEYIFSLSGKDEVKGANTSKLTVYVLPPACYEEYEYYCVISNSKGTVETVHAKLDAQHVYGWFENNGNGTHSYRCYGDGCDASQFTKPHRYSEWTVTPATETSTGSREQKCMDCGAQNSVVIPKVEPGHVHVYDQVLHNATDHWYGCVCGVDNYDATVGGHSPWGNQYTIIRQATETSSGLRSWNCYVCGVYREEVIPRLEHTHTYWPFQRDSDGDPITGKCGRCKEYHYYYCKSGDGAMLKEEHDPVTFTWDIVKEATSTEKGKLYRYCETCGYSESKYYDYGTYPIFILGGTASHDAAAPGTTVTVTYTKSPGLRWTNITFWKDMATVGQYVSAFGLKPVSLSPSDHYSTATFVMPDGPVMLQVYNTEDCHHAGGTVMGEREEPTCLGYGREPDVLCAVCGAVVRQGNRIPALGHDMSTTPVPGTTVDEYCTLWTAAHPLAGEPNPATHGYSGDFKCNRCGMAVKGKKTPLKHGRHDKYHEYTSNPGRIWSDWYDQTKDAKEPTCTSSGYTGNKYCKYCKEVAEKGESIPRLGHNWGEWEVTREASTMVKGMEQRHCLNDASHKQTRVTDYSGPDYRLKADKTKLKFEFTYGDTEIEPQTITFTSVGRNKILAIDDAEVDLFGNQLNVDGLKLTVRLDPQYATSIATSSGEQKIGRLLVAITEDGTTEEFSAPTFTCTVRMNKADVGLRIETESKIGRPRCPIATPLVTSDVDGLKLVWKSSDNSVATVDANTGRVMPLSGGTTTITAIYEGDEHYKSAKVSYTLNVIGENKYTGIILQSLYTNDGQNYSSFMGRRNVTIAPSVLGAGLVDVTFSNFNMPEVGYKIQGFTIQGVQAHDADDGTSIYTLPSSRMMELDAGDAGMMEFNVMLEGVQFYPETPMFKLTLKTPTIEDFVWFSATGMSQEEIDEIITGIDVIEISNKSDIFDLQGRKLEKITQPGIYIKDGKKVAVK